MLPVVLYWIVYVPLLEWASWLDWLPLLLLLFSSGCCMMFVPLVEGRSVCLSEQTEKRRRL